MLLNLLKPTFGHHSKTVGTEEIKIMFQSFLITCINHSCQWGRTKESVQTLCTISGLVYSSVWRYDICWQVFSWTRHHVSNVHTRPWSWIGMTKKSVSEALIGQNNKILSSHWLKLSPNSSKIMTHMKYGEIKHETWRIFSSFPTTARPLHFCTKSSRKLKIILLLL